jgi:hypothetical protein
VKFHAVVTTSQDQPHTPQLWEAVPVESIADPDGETAVRTALANALADLTVFLAKIVVIELDDEQLLAALRATPPTIGGTFEVI